MFIDTGAVSRRCSVKMSQNSQKNTSDRVYPARYKMGTFAIILKNISDEPSLDFKEIRVETDS